MKLVSTSLYGGAHTCANFQGHRSKDVGHREATKLVVFLTTKHRLSIAGGLGHAYL